MTVPYRVPSSVRAAEKAAGRPATTATEVSSGLNSGCLQVSSSQAS